MEKTKLGTSNLEVSALAMGTDSIGSRMGRQASFKLFDFFHRKGGDVPGHGQHVRMLASRLRGWGE
jgi:hypothetical protein